MKAASLATIIGATYRTSTAVCRARSLLKASTPRRSRLTDGLLAALDSERRIFLYPVEGGAPKAAPGPVEPGELGEWTPDGRRLYVTEKVGGVLVQVFRRDIASGRTGALERDRAGRSRRNPLPESADRDRREDRTFTGTGVGWVLSFSCRDCSKTSNISPRC